MEDSMLFTQIVRPVAILLVGILAIVAVCAIAYYGWLEYSGEMEVRRLVAQAAADEAAAERANAEAVLAPAEAAALTGATVGSNDILRRVDARCVGGCYFHDNGTGPSVRICTCDGSAVKAGEKR